MENETNEIADDDYENMQLLLAQLKCEEWELCQKMNANKIQADKAKQKYKQLETKRKTKIESIQKQKQRLVSLVNENLDTLESILERLKQF